MAIDFEAMSGRRPVCPPTPCSPEQTREIVWWRTPSPVWPATTSRRSRTTGVAATQGLRGIP